MSVSLVQHIGLGSQLASIPVQAQEDLQATQVTPVHGDGWLKYSEKEPSSWVIGADWGPETVGSDLFDIHPGFGRMRNLPFFQVLSAIEQPGYCLADHPVTRGLPPPPTTPSPSFLSGTVVQIALSNILGVRAEVPSVRTAPELISQFQRLVPERYEGDIAEKLGQILDLSSPVSVTLPSLFALVAFLASNNYISPSHLDPFLRWIVDEGHTKLLARFMEIQTPTVHAFSDLLKESAIRIKNVQLLDTLLKRGIKFNNHLLCWIAHIGDTELTRRVLENTDIASLPTSVVGELLHNFVLKGQFDLARFLLTNGVSVDAPSLLDGTALIAAIGRNDIKAAKFLLGMGADVNFDRDAGDYNRLRRGALPKHMGKTTNPLKQIASLDFYCSLRDCNPLRRAVLFKKTEMVALLLEHGADISGEIEDLPILEWAGLHCKSVFELLKERLGLGATGFLPVDVVEAANRGGHALADYIAGQPEGVTAHQLERALEASILSNHLTATITLLQYGVNPNGPTLPVRPLTTALRKAGSNSAFAEVLLEHRAGIGQPKLLEDLVATGKSHLVKAALAFPTDLEQRMEALVRAAERGDIASAALLLQTKVDVNTPLLLEARVDGMPLNPLQAAAYWGHEDMALFLISKGADVNAPAHPRYKVVCLSQPLSYCFVMEPMPRRLPQCSMV
ncbi:Ankyrin repeat and KH domain-containing protein 1 [Madurella mycetomatis]|uniref:Ankyrin repeat and KH domain-containing protein 1 n=1 Tax=Madurella mycetomatis TaxID=100816 RepID=A0A175VXE6_9PEZI|nr:Ankyrin repeat and KH domain-containing protein 1 [Madurella mycetomatis]